MSKHNEAMDLLKSGRPDQAWEVAKQDEFLSPTATKEAWLDFARITLEMSAVTDKANASPQRGD